MEKTGKSKTMTCGKTAKRIHEESGDTNSKKMKHMMIYLSTCIHKSMDAVYGLDPTEEIALLMTENERLRSELEFFQESACKLEFIGTK